MYVYCLYHKDDVLEKSINNMAICATCPRTFCKDCRLTKAAEHFLVAPNKNGFKYGLRCHACVEKRGPFPTEVLNAFKNATAKSSSKTKAKKSTSNDTNSKSKKLKKNNKSNDQLSDDEDDGDTPTGQRKSPPEKITPRSNPILEDLVNAMCSRKLGNDDPLKYRAGPLRKLVADLYKGQSKKDPCDVTELVSYLENDNLLKAATRPYEELHILVFQSSPKFDTMKISTFATETVKLLQIIHTQFCETEGCKVCRVDLREGVDVDKAKSKKRAARRYLELFALCVKLAREELKKLKTQQAKHAKNASKVKEVKNFGYDKHKVSLWIYYKHCLFPISALINDSIVS